MSAGVPMRELPRYKSHKIVHALKIKELEFEGGTCLIVFEDKEYAPVDVGLKYYNKHKPQSGGYYVVYEDGYKSWSPAEAFESGYTLVPESRSSSFDCALALGGKIHWQDLAKQLAEVWWEVTKVGGTLQHGYLDKPETMFSVVLEKHGGQCFHGETPMEAWKKADDWIKSPERPSFDIPKIVREKEKFLSVLESGDPLKDFYDEDDLASAVAYLLNNRS